MPKPERRAQLQEIIEILKGQREPEKGMLESPLPGGIELKPAPPPRDRINEGNIEQAEIKTIEVASQMIRVLEDAISKWEGAKEKPDELRAQFEDYGRFHAELSDWEEKILKSRAKKEELDFFARMDRLLAFSRICAAHKGM